MKKILSKLKALHPLPNVLAELTKYGFNSDIGGDSKWITDGHAIFWRAGFDVSMLANESTYLGKKPTPEGIAKLWDEAKTREDIPVHILGSVDREFSETDFEDDEDGIAESEKSILRDTFDRIIYADAFKLAFTLYALKPDALSVARDDGPSKFIRFMRGGEIVGCLMPMRARTKAFNSEEGYDVDGEPLSLEIVIEP